MADLLIKTNMKYNIMNYYLLSSCKGEGMRKKATSLQNGGPPHPKTVDPKRDRC